MALKIALIGYGKMGKTIESVAQARRHQVVCVVEKETPEAFSSEAFASADVAIEFTAPTQAYQNCLKAFNAGLKVVCGTTGWIEPHLPELRRLCKPEGGNTLFWASNFSLGVALFTALAQHASKVMDRFADYIPQITETHHIHKLDAPSGTAISLAQACLTQMTRKKNWVKDEAQNPEQLPIHSVREGEVFGIHSLCFTSPEDEITLTHKAYGREGFAKGAVLAAEFVHTHQGLLGMGDLLPTLF